MFSISRAMVLALSVGAAGSFGVASAAGAGEVLIGTGSPAGVYYQVGRSICRIMNQVDPVEGLTCNSAPTAGSTFNLEALRRGELQVGVVQSDRQFDAVAGEGPFASVGPDPALRSLFSFHVEPFTLVVRRDSGILSLGDLVGRRVNIGNPGSGQRGTMELVMAAMSWTADDFELVEQLPASQHSLALCHDRVQAIVYTVGHPNPSITQATGLCDANIVEVSGPEINTLLETKPYFVRAEIPGGIYAANPDSVQTFGVIATVVTTESMDEQTAYAIVSRVFGNLDVIKRSHPAFGTLTAEAMSHDGLSAPLHPGAARYFKENGLVWQTAGGGEVPSQ